MKDNEDTLTWDSTLTIVIPTFNSIEDIPGCINSIQSVIGNRIGKNVFVLIQDGQSTDGTVEYVESTGIRGLTLASEQDMGVYDAMNKAIAKTDTDWIYFLGSDDRLLPDFRIMLNNLKDTENIYYANVRFASTGKRYDGAFSIVKLVFRNICHQSMFFPSHYLKQHPYSLDFPVKSDWASNIRLFASVTFQHMELDVALYNDRGGLSSLYGDEKFDKEKALLFYEFHGYWMKVVCDISPKVTKVYQFLARKAQNRRR